MYEVIDADDKAAAQQMLHEQLIHELSEQGERSLSFRGGGGLAPVWSNGESKLYYAYIEPHDEQGTLRHWNSFGFFSETETLRIVVEVNIPSEAGHQKTEGFLARDPDTNSLFLMHSGRMGGGVKGLTQAAFVAFSRDLPVVVRSGAKIRTGYVVAEIGSPDVLAQIRQFVETVARFKGALADGLLADDAFAKKVGRAKELMREYVGRKTGRRNSEISYVTHHGAVVEALALERGAHLAPGEDLDKSILIDLCVRRGGRIVEIYEVKSKTDRSSLYEAIGQLVTHAGSPPEAAVRTLVLPEGEIAADISAALDRERMIVRRYRLVGTGEVKRVKLL